jgi:hypothetical protein
MGGRTHGLTRSPEWYSWIAMRRRCLDPKDKDFPNYGGRGIKIDPDWVDDFMVFYEDMGDRPGGTTLNRINPNGHYTARNVEWADAKTQGRSRRNVRRVTYQGLTMTLSEWAERLQVPYHTLYDRLKRGMTVEQAFTMKKNAQF